MTRLMLTVTMLAASAASAAAGEHVTAHAYDLDNGRLLYTEVNERTLDHDRVVAETVRYVLPDGSELGHKTVDYSADRFVPTYRLELTREGYTEGVSADGSTLTMMRQEPRGTPETSTMPKEGLLVTDAGMLELIVARFDELTRGATLSFRVVAPGRLSSYKFRARRVADTTLDGKPAAQVQVEMDSMLKLFAGPLVFLFSPDRRLLEFRGPTNVRDPATGKEYTVRLTIS